MRELSDYTVEQGETLLAIARRAVEATLGLGELDWRPAPWLEEIRSSFVTITSEGRLRGCVGRVEPKRPLADDLAENAVAAALRDPRFPPLGVDELPGCRFEVSLLSPLAPIVAELEADLHRQLRPGVHGLVLGWRGRRATFLPQVWEQLQTPDVFVDHLRVKAGLAPEAWYPEMTWSVYEVRKWSEP